MKISCITHVPFEGPEAIADWAEEKGHVLQIYPSYENSLPNSAETDLLVVMGGPMGVRDKETLPWMKAEAEFISNFIETGKKVLGICLGAQLLADALGAEVKKNSEKEIGWFPVEVTSEAKGHFLSEGLEGHIPVFHWHGDIFDAPASALPLFTNRMTPVQGFLYKDAVLALQFHLESTEKSVQLLIEHARDDMEDSPYVSSERDMKADTEAFASDAHEVLFDLLDRFTAVRSTQQ